MRTNRTAFTLIELMIVVAMISVMAGIELRYLIAMQRQYRTDQWKLESEWKISQIERKTRAATANLLSVKPGESASELLLELEDSDGKPRQHRLIVDSGRLLMLPEGETNKILLLLGEADSIMLTPHRIKGREGFFVRAEHEKAVPLRQMQTFRQFFVGVRR
jgi:prepilin-type N-terminal cleavage/methylation domain-containing protein